MPWLLLGAMDVAYLPGSTSSFQGLYHPRLGQHTSVLAQVAESRSCQNNALNPEYIELRDAATEKLESAPVMTIWTSDGHKINGRVAREDGNSITVAVLGINCITTNEGGAIRVPSGLRNSRLLAKKGHFLELGPISTSMDYYGYTLVEYRTRIGPVITIGDPVATLRLGGEELRIILIERDSVSTDFWGRPLSRTGYAYTGLISRNIVSESAAQSLQEGKCLVSMNHGEQYRCSYGMNVLFPNHLRIRFDAPRLYSVRPSTQHKRTTLMD